MKNVQSSKGNSPFNADPGSIVVVAAGAPGTANPTAGDITVKGDGGAFYNGGEMSYGSAADFPTKYTLGIFVPTKCSSDLNWQRPNNGKVYEPFEIPQ